MTMTKQHEHMINHLTQTAVWRGEFNLRRGDITPTDFNYICLEDFVMDRGEKPPASEPLTEEQYDYLMRVAGRTGTTFRPKQCFHNSQMLVLSDFEGRMEYYEGIAYTGVLPVHHAWVLLDGKLVDLTRSLREGSFQEFLDGEDPQEDLKDRVLGVVPDGWYYYGSPFQKEGIRQYIYDNEETHSVLDNWKAGYPAYKLERINPVSDEVLEQIETTQRAFESAKQAMEVKHG